MKRDRSWPALEFISKDIIWVDVTTEMLLWLDATDGGRYRLDYIDTNSLQLRGAICFEYTTDSTMFKLQWL